MPTRDGYPEGVPAWVDLATTDVDAARSFYAELFGWDYQEPEDESTPYWMAMQEGRMAAGIGPAQEGLPVSVWSTYFAVDDADATVTKIEEAGGQVISEPMDIFDSARMAIAADPTGAVFGIWQSRDHKGAGIVNEHGTLDWNELQTDDLDRAVAFYQEVLGLDPEETSGATSRYVMLSVDGRGVAGAMPVPMDDIPNHWGVYFSVDDLDEATGQVASLGGATTYGPIEVPDVGTISGFTDTTGAHFTLIELAHETD